MKTIKLQIPDGKKAEWVNGVLTLVDEKVKDNRPVTERIKTFEDACRELGKSHPLVNEYKMITNSACFDNVALSKDLQAYLKLRIITAALNEGWKPQFTEDEFRWTPWFYLYTKEELDEKSDAWKRYNCLIPFAGSLNFGLSAKIMISTLSKSCSAVSSFLCFQNSGLATYCIKQFFELWADYYLISK